MSRLEALMAELCPDGVEVKELSQVLTIKNGKDYKGFDKGNIPVYGTGGIMTYIDHAAFEKPSVLIPRKGSIDKLYYVDVPFWTVDTIFYTDINTDIIEPKYVFYYLQAQHLERLNTAGGVPSLTQAVLNSVKIPLPPLPVQREIVRILDNFTELTAELIAELTAELSARKKQYEYYRDSLFNFDGQGDFEVQWLSLSEIAEIGTGSSNTNEELEVGNYPFFVRSQEVRQKNTFEFDETAIITSGDGVGVGKIFHYVEGKYALHQRAYRMHITNESVLPRYYFYYMKSAFLPYIEKNSFHSSVTSIRRPMLNNFPVPVPPIEVQARIVAILDRFDTLCNDLTSGLPAEIEARRQQYEYYRDQLLTFKACLPAGQAGPSDGQACLPDRQEVSA
ncbi:restriction endonuclease subunit S [Acetobacterium wieringae]|uniref:Restriction endonuclease subunit S n=1 Tax=Acetobacterium wieringae TaxID=52694 RepID=A0A5D0WKZ2_9FIRM|nr:restriction endonuclease subunit S [Acetobacterium wieringae]TYC84754.1 restriction endonuclease subunit S [Acetobacterium wieringae]